MSDKLFEQFDSVVITSGARKQAQQALIAHIQTKIEHYRHEELVSEYLKQIVYARAKKEYYQNALGILLKGKLT